MDASIKGFFNPRTEGDSFRGLNSSMDGTVAPSIIQGLPAFLKAAGRDYWIRKDPAVQRFTGPDGTLEYADVEGQYHLVRSSDARVVSPHTVTGQYAPLSLIDVADELQPWCDAGWATPDGVYSTRGESLELLSLRLDGGDVTLPANEKFLHYVIFENPHGAGGTCKGKIIDWRVVCCNTFARAIAAKADFSVRHRMSATLSPEDQQSAMLDRAKRAVQAWATVREHIAALASRIEAHKSIPVSLALAESLTDRLLGIEGAKPDDISGQKARQKATIMRAFADPRIGTNGADAWDFYNAVTFELSSPLSEANAKSKVSSVDRLVRNVADHGSGATMESKALALIEDLS